MRMSLNDNAEQLFRDLIDDYPNTMAFRVGQAEAMAASGATDAALKIYAEAIRLFPRNGPLTISYAEDADRGGQTGRGARGAARSAEQRAPHATRSYG